MTFDYEQELKYDLIEVLKPALEKGLIYIREGDYKFVFKTIVAWNMPWVFGGKKDYSMNCPLFHSVILKYFDFIPERCAECWKVVVRPNTLSQLWKVSDLQQTTDRWCKAGIETRKTVSALYGAYWYNRSIDEGFECKAYVKEEMAKISPDIGVILKRGCTEFEHKFGNSTQWTVDRDWEAYVNERIVIDDFPMPDAPEQVTRHTKLNWIRFAYENGDMAYKEFTGGKSLYPDPIQYFTQEEYEEA